jgi:regulator of protease activity HflC (stomatin/prohibitin superfamily)
MKNIIILAAAVLIVALGFYVYDQETQGPAEELGEAIDEIAN